MKLLILLTFIPFSLWAQHNPQATTPLSDVAAAGTPGQANFRGLGQPAGTQDCDPATDEGSKSFILLSPEQVQSGRVILPANSQPMPNGSVRVYGPLTVVEDVGDVKKVEELIRGQSTSSDALNYSVIDPAGPTHSQIRVKGTGVRYETERFRIGDSDGSVRVDVRHNRAMISLKMTLGDGQRN